MERPRRFSQDEAGSSVRNTKVAKAGELALAAIEIYCKVYLSAVLKRRRVASALHEQLRPFGNKYGDLMKFVDRYESNYFRAVRERRTHEVIFGELLGCVRWFTTVVDDVAEELLRKNNLPTFPTKRHDTYEALKRGIKRIKLDDWSRFRCTWKPTMETNGLWTIF